MIDTIMSNQNIVNKIMDKLSKKEDRIISIINNNDTKKATDFTIDLIKISKAAACIPVQRQIERFSHTLEYCKRLNIPSLNGKEIQQAWLL